MDLADRIIAAEGGNGDGRQISPFPDTDLRNCERMAAQHGRDIHFTPEKGWLVWDGQRWCPDAHGRIMELAKETARNIFDELKNIPEEQRRRLFHWAQRSQGRERLSAMVYLTQSEPGIPASFRDFDRDPWLFNCANGIVDLRTGELREHRREDLCARVSSIEYDPDAECKLWLEFLDRVMDGNPYLVDYLQRAVGYSLTGLTHEQCLFFCHGLGANGKSVFLETVQALLGDYGITAPTETIMQGKPGGVPNDVARLAGARFVSVNETAEAQRLNEPLIKDLTGGDTVTARFLHHEYFDFRPIFKLWIRGNHKPQIRGTDEGIWRRVQLIPFTVRIPEAERDPTLPARLRAERSGIFSWAVRGCLTWQEKGLRPPNEVKTATTEYRRESDVLGAFIEDRCSLSEMSQVTAKELYGKYVEWTRGAGEHAVSQRRFGQAMTERGFARERTMYGYLYKGISLA